jgi:hypothetical protein
MDSAEEEDPFSGLAADDFVGVVDDEEEEEEEEEEEDPFSGLAAGDFVGVADEDDDAGEKHEDEEDHFSGLAAGDFAGVADEEDGSETDEANIETISDNIPVGLEGVDLGDVDLMTRMETLGYAFIDDAASLPWCEAIRAEICLLYELSAMSCSQNKIATQRSGEGSEAKGAIVNKEGVFELDVLTDAKLLKPQALTVAKTLANFFEHKVRLLIKKLNQACPSLMLTGLDSIKLQYNTGVGGCFPIHYDTSGKNIHYSGSQRGLTTILYLNPEWAEPDGGELRIYPFPYNQEDIAPRMGRLAMFSSTHMAHRTMPATAPRACLSMWFAGSQAPFPRRMPAAATDGSSEDSLQLFRFLWEPSNRKVLTRILFAEEWAESMSHSFGSGESVVQSLALHFKEVEGLKSAIPASLLEVLENCLPLTQ